MEERITIRMATTSQADIDVLHKYVYMLGRYQRMAESSVTISKETLKEQIGNKTLESAIAFLDGEPVGIGLFYTLASGFTGGTSMFLNIYYVEEHLRGMGIGKAIMAYLSKLSLERGYERIEWLCLNWNEPSLKFYRGIQSREIDTVITFRLMPDDMRRLNEE
ncbi:MAG: GNAT family N-acetyltransferase [Clostridiales bacterium]|nr:GNAT family N-acetyltransferase [Clostridiales bacterium]